MPRTRYSLFALLTASLLVLPTVVRAQQAVPSLSVVSTSGNAVLAPQGSVLVDQIGDPSGVGFPSQEFETANAAFDNMGADDFVVPTGGSWTVSNAFVIGAYSQDSGPAEIFDVTFFADGGGVPGEEVVTFEDVAGEDTLAAGSFVISFPEPVVLSAGTYWFSIQADMDFGTAGQWFWVKQGTETAIGAEVHWINPGGGFETGCTDWAPAGTVCGVGLDEDGLLHGLDASFRLEGTVSATGLESTAPGVFEIEAAFPNPFASRSRVAFTVYQSQPVTVTLYDALGREVRTLFAGVAPAGQRQVVDIDASGLSTGMYFLRLSGEDVAGMQRLVVVR